jgi:polysaccharide export outer membrane protein
MFEGDPTLAVPKRNLQSARRKKLWKTERADCKSCANKIYCCANLLLPMFAGNLCDLQAGSSRRSLTKRVRSLALVMAGVSFMVSAVAAQQPAGGTDSQSDAPAEIPSAAQPLPQAAVSARGAPASAPTNTSDNPPKETAEQLVPMKLGVGDLVEVSVYNVPELATKARISTSGDVYLPLIDYVHLEGLTQEEAQALLEKRLADGGFVRNPHVTIFVDEAASQGVTIIGEVTRPGIYPDVADHKLYEVISQAGGFSSSASRKIAIIRRNQPEPIRVNLPRNLADDLSGNVEIMPGDTITVPRAPIIYVVGDVARPSGLLVDNGTLTVLQALALAGGPNHTAKLGNARILHKGPTGMTESRIAIKKMLRAKAPDVTLQADDILFIPVSGARVLANAGFQTAVTAAGAVAIYSVHP